MPTPHKDDIDAAKGLIGDLQFLEHRAHRLGLTLTGHAINNAKNACGWELAGNDDRAAAASRGERLGD